MCVFGIWATYPLLDFAQLYLVRAWVAGYGNILQPTRYSGNTTEANLIVIDTVAGESQRYINWLPR